MKRARRAELRKLGKFHASMILKSALDSWDPEFDLAEEEMSVLEAEIERISQWLWERSR